MAPSNSVPPTAPALWYVGANSRSGSTLLTGLISATVGGFNAGELHLLWRSFASGRLCTCMQALPDCPVWGPVAEIVIGSTDVSRGIADAARIEAAEPAQRWAIVRGTALPVATEIVELRRRTESAVLQVTGSRAIVDNSKIASTAVVAAKLPRPMRVVHLVRDPRAVAFSMSNPKPDPSMHGTLMPQRTPARSAVNWVSLNLAYERLAKQQTIHVTRARYEDLADAPDRTCTDLGIGRLPTQPVRSGEHSIAGNPWRFDPDQEIRRDDAWVQAFPRRDRRVVNALTVVLRRRYGYPA